MAILSLPMRVSFNLPYFGATTITVSNGPISRPNPLYEAIRTERWQEALDILETMSPNSSKARRPGSDGLLPLHMLCWLGAGEQRDGSSERVGGSDNDNDDDSDDESETSSGFQRRQESETQVELCQQVLRALLRTYPGAARKKGNTWCVSKFDLVSSMTISRLVSLRYIICTTVSIYLFALANHSISFIVSPTWFSEIHTNVINPID